MTPSLGVRNCRFSGDVEVSMPLNEQKQSCGDFGHISKKNRFHFLETRHKIPAQMLRRTESIGADAFTHE